MAGKHQTWEKTQKVPTLGRIHSLEGSLGKVDLAGLQNLNPVEVQALIKQVGII